MQLIKTAALHVDERRDDRACSPLPLPCSSPILVLWNPKILIQNPFTLVMVSSIPPATALQLKYPLSLETQLPLFILAAQIPRLQRFYPHSDVQGIGFIHIASEGPWYLSSHLKPDLILVCDF